jgi:hypothetical protein
MLRALPEAAVDESTMLLDIDASALTKMACVLLAERGSWSLKQWRNQCRFFAALAGELENRALSKGRHWEASKVHDVAWRFAMQALEGWPLATSLDWPSAN